MNSYLRKKSDFLWFFAFTFKNENYNGAMIKKKIEIFQWLNDLSSQQQDNKILKVHKIKKVIMTQTHLKLKEDS